MAIGHINRVAAIAESFLESKCVGILAAGDKKVAITTKGPH